MGFTKIKTHWTMRASRDESPVIRLLKLHRQGHVQEGCVLSVVTMVKNDLHRFIIFTPLAQDPDEAISQALSEAYGNKASNVVRVWQGRGRWYRQRSVLRSDGSCDKGEIIVYTSPDDDQLTAEIIRSVRDILTLIAENFDLSQPR